MKIILQKPVEKLGDPGDVVEVADGYARNYLVPRGLAIKAHKGAVKQADTLQRAHATRVTKQKSEFEAVASKLISDGPIRVSAREASSESWVATITVVPCRAARPVSSSTTSAPVFVSRLPVGSSARITRGSLTRARAIPTRCCSPPESWLGR